MKFMPVFDKFGPFCLTMRSMLRHGWVSAFLMCAFVPMALFTSVPASAQVAQPLPPAQLDQLVAPIALYPDSLLSQVLMASTYPLEVVEAERWRAGQPDTLSDAQLTALLQNQDWDPSVKSLTAFPDVLDMMSDKIDWTQQLGDAFLDQQPDVMDAVQRLRAQARAAGHLQSGQQQRVVVVQDSPAIIQIVPVAPDIVYVPVYNPLVVYGSWRYPAYRPFYWHPRAYVSAPGVFISFGTGLAMGPALWGHVDWHRHSMHINVRRYNRFNHVHVTNNRWVHNSAHRRGVEYRGRGPDGHKHSGRSSTRDNAREHYRHNADAGRKKLNDPRNRQQAEKAAGRDHGRSGPGDHAGSRGRPNGPDHKARQNSQGKPGGTHNRGPGGADNRSPERGGNRTRTSEQSRQNHGSTPSRQTDKSAARPSQNHARGGAATRSHSSATRQAGKPNSAARQGGTHNNRATSNHAAGESRGATRQHSSARPQHEARRAPRPQAQQQSRQQHSAQGHGGGGKSHQGGGNQEKKGDRH